MSTLFAKSLLANLELVQIRNPELRSSCIFLRTWVHLHLKGRVDASKALYPSWLESLNVLTGMPCDELLRPISISFDPSTVASGFGFFEDDEIFSLTDGHQKVALADIETVHPCIGVLDFLVEKSQEVYYLINGNYCVGLNPGVPLSEFRSLLLVRVKTDSQMSCIVPMRISTLCLNKEVSRAAA